GSQTVSRDLRVLLVEDSEDDELLLLNDLELAGYNVVCRRVEDAEHMRSALAEPWDIVICDYTMPRFSAQEALSTLQDSGLDIPFLILSGAIGEDIAVGAMRSGASDYIMKGNRARLLPAVDRELREAAERRARRAA